VPKVESRARGSFRIFRLKLAYVSGMRMIMMFGRLNENGVLFEGGTRIHWPMACLK
jgi:hypothetical protein